VSERKQTNFGALKTQFLTTNSQITEQLQNLKTQSVGIESQDGLEFTL